MQVAHLTETALDVVDVDFHIVLKRTENGNKKIQIRIKTYNNYTLDDTTKLTKTIDTQLTTN